MKCVVCICVEDLEYGLFGYNTQ